MKAQSECAPATTSCFGKSAKKAPKQRRKLDNVAIIFPPATRFNDPQIFRLSCILREDINPLLLQQSLNELLPHFETFSVRIARGFFWWHFKKSTVVPSIQKDSELPCEYFDINNSNAPLFRVLYEGSSIHLETYHALTDGAGGLSFLTALLYRYCQLAYPHELPPSYRTKLFGLEHTGPLLDAYIQHTQQMEKKSTIKLEPEKLTLRIKGKLLDDGVSRVQTETIPVEVLKALSSRYGVTLGVLLTAAIAYALYEEFGVPEGEALGISVPMNLRAIFELETALNFFSNIVIRIPHECFDSFESVLNEAQKQFSEKRAKDQIERLMVERVRIEKSPFIRMVPLAIKEIVLRRVYLREKKKRSTTFSNLKTVSVNEAFKPFIQGFRFVISASPYEPVRFTACAYDGMLSLSCTAKLEKQDVMGKLMRLFKEG